MHNPDYNGFKPVSLAAMRTWQSGFLQMAVHRMTKKYSDEFLQAYGLTTMQWLVIGAIYESGNKGIRVTELADRADTTLSYMTTMLNKLEELSIIGRIKSSGDSRARTMVVCEHFRQTCQEIEEGLRDAFRKKIYSRISRQDLEHYITVLQLLAADDKTDDQAQSS